MPFTIEDLNYEKDSKERMPWEHYLEQYGQADPQVLGENPPKTCWKASKRLPSILGSKKR